MVTLGFGGGKKSLHEVTGTIIFKTWGKKVQAGEYQLT